MQLDPSPITVRPKLPINAICGKSMVNHRAPALKRKLSALTASPASETDAIPPLSGAHDEHLHDKPTMSLELCAGSAGISKRFKCNLGLKAVAIDWSRNKGNPQIPLTQLDPLPLKAELQLLIFVSRANAPLWLWLRPVAQQAGHETSESQLQDYQILNRSEALHGPSAYRA